MTLVSLLVSIAAWAKQRAATVCRAHPGWCRTSSSWLDWGQFSRFAARNATFSHRRQKSVWRNCGIRAAKPVPDVSGAHDVLHFIFCGCWSCCQRAPNLSRLAFGALIDKNGLAIDGINV